MSEPITCRLLDVAPTEGLPAYTHVFVYSTIFTIYPNGDVVRVLEIK